MVDKNKLFESLANFIDATASEESELERSSIKEFIDGKSKQILERMGESKIKIEGDDVHVNGKKVGTIKSDVDDAEGSIEFESEDGKNSKEFDSLDAFYEYLSELYKIKESSKKLGESDEQEQLDEAGDAEKAINTQDAMKSDRAKRWDYVHGKVEKDGKAGDYDSHDVRSNHVDPERGGSEAAHDGHNTDSRHKKGYYDSKDPRPTHKDPERGGSEAAHDGGEQDIDTDMKYDAHDVRKQHN